MTMKGTVRNGVIVVEGPPLPEGAIVQVTLNEVPASDHAPTLRERLLKHAGTVGDLPADLAEQHDHYIHGTPKR